jgi:hypothetical protein
LRDLRYSTPAGKSGAAPGSNTEDLGVDSPGARPYNLLGRILQRQQDADG